MPILDMNKESYKEYISKSDKPVLVEFSAPWCGYCRRLQPALEQVAEQYKELLIFGQINIDNELELADAENIELVPTLLLYQKGNMISSIVAPESKSQLKHFIEEFLQKNEKIHESTEHIYDMIIIGGGPGGYTAALYAARAGLDTVVLEKLSPGGQMALTEQIDNYPGNERIETGRNGCG